MLDFQYPQVKVIQAITYMDGIMMKIGADKANSKICDAGDYKVSVIVKASA